MKPFDIKHIEAGEVLDSRGNPTVMTTVWLQNGAKAAAAVPSGASTGKFEAHELRDGQASRYNGKGVLKACSNVNIRIAEVIKGMDAEDQEAVDQAMIAKDNTENKSFLGANAILSVSMAVAKAVARGRRMPLYRSLQESFGFQTGEHFPTPIMNLINGGKHASSNILFQETQIIPKLDHSPTQQIEAGSEVFHALKKVLEERGYDTDVGDEGGYGPDVKELDEVFAMIVEAIEASGHTPGEQISLGIDPAVSGYYEADTNRYIIGPPKENITAEDLGTRYQEWIKQYPLISIEDPFAEEAWDDWAAFTQSVGDTTLIIGDDLLVTNTERLQTGIDTKAMNAILVKPNQIGTVTETVNAIKLAQAHNIAQVISHRSGETNDTFIVDLAVATGAQYLKAGAPSRGERVAKYNRLLEIERDTSTP